MNVVHISTGFPLSFPGGITNYLRTLCQSQIDAGLKVAVVAGREPAPAQLPAELELIEYRSPTVRPFTLAWRSLEPGWVRLRKRIEARQPDLIHVHMVLGLGRSVIRWLSQQQIPYVVSIHDYYLACPRIFMVDYKGETCRQIDLARCSHCVSVLEQSDVLRKVSHMTKVTLPRVRSRSVFDRAQVMRALLGNARFVLPVSERVAQIVHGFSPDSRIQVMHIGNRSAGAVKDRVTPSGPLKAVFIGTLSKIKGAMVLQELMKGVTRKDMEFHFHGRAEDPVILQSLLDAGLQHHGPYKPADLPGIMSNASLGMVLPVWEDNGPQVAMEFINYKVPVLATNMGGLPDFVSEKTGRLFDPFSHESVAGAIAWLDRVTQGDLADLSANIRPLTTPEEHSDRMLLVYEESLREAGASDSRPRISAARLLDRSHA